VKKKTEQVLQAFSGNIFREGPFFIIFRKSVRKEDSFRTGSENGYSTGPSRGRVL
jgi:hypothetical protein